MLTKQLNHQKFESLDYGPYNKLKKLFHDPSFEPLQVDEIDLQGEQAQEMPNVLCLHELPNLQVLVLANNQIRRFPGKTLAKELQKLEILDLSNNLIEELDDIVDLNLPHLHILDYQGNYVTTYLQRINQIEMILCPKRYVPYNPVKVLTAQYNQLPVCRLTEEKFLQEKQNLRGIERAPEEFRPEELMNAVSKYSHKNTLGTYSIEICPIPRKTRFPNLEYLNGTLISKLDVMRVTGVSNYKMALLDPKSELQVTAKRVKRSKIHQDYIKRYTKRINRLIEGEPVVPGPDDILKAQHPKQLDPKKFSVWETPLDIQLKDAEFSANIEELRNEQQEYKRIKRKRVTDKQLRQLERIKKKHPSFTDSDDDLLRQKRIKPKLNLSRNENRLYSSSESALSEDPTVSMHSSSDNSEHSTQQRTQVPSQSNVQSLRKQLKNNSKGSPKNSEPIIQQHFSERRLETPTAEKSQKQMRFDTVQRKQQPPAEVVVDPHCPIPPQPIPVQRLVASMLQEENRNTFDVHNKLSSPHPIIRKSELDTQKMLQMKKIRIVVQRERAEIEALHGPPKEQPPKPIRYIETKKKSKLSKEPPQRELVKLHGDLSKVDFQRVKIPLEEMIPTAEQGVPERFRQEFLFDGDNQMHKDLLHYKGILEESRNLRELCKEMDRKVEIVGATKPDNELKFKACDFNMVHEYLGHKDKMSPFELREVIYGANDYDQQNEPKIIESNIIDCLEKDNVSREERQVLYKWLEILDDIKLKKIKTDEKRLRRIELKEIERAQSFAHLAYHYQKLKKYVPEEKLQKYVKMMGIPIEEILQEGNNQMSRKGKNTKRPQSQAMSRTQQSRSSTALKKDPKKEMEFTKQIAKVVSEKGQIIDAQKVINDQRYQSMKQEIMSKNGHLAENNPHLLQFLEQREVTRSKVMGKVSKHMVSFETMMEQNLRKIQDQFVNKHGPVGLEEQMMRYAQEFKEKIKHRERLQQNIKQYISETQQKMDEFWLWEADQHELRHDKGAQLMRSIMRMNAEDY